jgi:hypothetical protein
MAANLSDRKFVMRLALSYVAVPLVPPILLLLNMSRAAKLSFGDWTGIVIIYGAIGLAAMILLGTPLLALCLRFGKTGFAPFIAGGAISAILTVYAAWAGQPQSSLIELFAILGAAAGGVFRLILFGFGSTGSA